MVEAPHRTAWIVATGLVSASAGVLLGITLAPDVEPPSVDGPTAAVADSKELLVAIESLREDLKRGDWDKLVAPVPMMTKREPVESVPSVEVEELRVLVAEIRRIVEVEELRALVAEMRRIVEDGGLVAEPLPVAALRDARDKDLEAVRSVCDPVDWRETYRELLYQPVQVALARFGRPDGIDEKGRLFWLAPGDHYHGLSLSIREGAVVNVEWMPKVLGPVQVR